MRQSNAVLETMMNASRTMQTEETPNSITISVKTDHEQQTKEDQESHKNEPTDLSRYPPPDSEPTGVPPSPSMAPNLGESPMKIDPCPNQPADLSNKKPENVTCVPEIDFIKEEANDNASEYSNSSDPERLEVDMSQVKKLKNGELYYIYRNR
jgi:hypothetical protein